MSRIFRDAAPLAGLLLACLASCGPQTAGSGGNASAAAERAAANAAAPAPAPAPRAAAKKDGTRIVLEGGGLRILPAEGGTPRLLAFGIPAATALDAVTKALGRAPSRRGSNEECGGGPQTLAAWDDVLTLWFSEEGGFVGWDSDGKLTTAGGIAIGSPLSAVRAIEGVEIAESSLGTEFTAAGMSGLLASKAPDAKVEALWAGSTCVFR